MGKRGPKPTPTETLKLRGSWRAKDRAEVPGDTSLPVAPGWLDSEARLCWDRTIPLIAEMRVLRAADANILARYCRMFSEWVELSAFLDAKIVAGESRHTYETVDGNGNRIIRVLPEAKRCLDLDAALRRIEGEFGLTASARATLKPETPAGPHGVAAFARKRG